MPPLVQDHDASQGRKEVTYESPQEAFSILSNDSGFMFVHLLPFPFFMKPTKCPLLSTFLWFLTSQDVTSSSSSSCSQFAFIFSAFLPPTSWFLPLWKPSLRVCLRCLPLSGQMLPVLLFRFSFPSEREMALEERGFLSLDVCGARPQTRTLLGSWFSPHFTDGAYLEVGDCKLAAGTCQAGEWFSVWVLKDLWKRVSEKAQADPVVCLGHHLSLWWPSHAFSLPSLRGNGFEIPGAVLPIVTNEASVHSLI